MARVRVAAQSRVVPQLLSVPELAKLLQVPVATIYRWRYRGEGPEPIRVGRHLRYDPADVAAWLEGQKVASASRYRRGA